MNIDDLKKIDRQICDLKRKRELRLDDYIKANCPYKVGDLITVTGYSFKGKKMMIEDITMKRGFSFGSVEDAYDYKFLYHGVIVNKNGSVGELYTSFSQKIKED
jgi:hypothetical protein